MNLNLYSFKLIKALFKTGIPREKVEKIVQQNKDYYFDEVDRKIFVYNVENIFNTKFNESELDTFQYFSAARGYLQKNYLKQAG